MAGIGNTIAPPELAVMQTLVAGLAAGHTADELAWLAVIVTDRLPPEIRSAIVTELLGNVVAEDHGAAVSVMRSALSHI